MASKQNGTGSETQANRHVNRRQPHLSEGKPSFRANTHNQREGGQSVDEIRAEIEKRNQPPAEQPNPWFGA
ncbi:hypothetical protein M8C13_04330 [Crossiella sp. SN42]|uniref:hypothetical protein n=1 Tax=Crossiella sp. SN42 TaxID=2944808 RepID=UPI00207D0AF5|nr:hypothetical protein [Crossiella sp. SN42]MCO1574985.1 hypothetical protein [Crossiella sp. SN42]